MKISYKHLIDNINEKPNIKELSDRLFQLGHEHDIEKEIFDFEFTPNRGDCLSLRGLLRDLNQFYGTIINKDTYKKNIDQLNFKFINNAKEACPKISFLKIDIESVPSSYDEELESYFSYLGIKKNNFFTDVSNFISYETGQPTHCYEALKVEDGISLNFTKNKQDFKTLLEKNIELESDNLVFTNTNDEPINLAGVIGGANTSCSENTKSVIVECAYFSPEAVLGKALKYSINSEAAHKFERNVDPNCHEYVVKRFVRIVENHTKILNVEISSNDYILPKEKTIEFNYKKINKVLGINISEKECVDCLNGFGFKIDANLIRVPSFRNDISHLNDIAEEVARAIGYNNINSKNFNFPSTKNKNNVDNIETKIKKLLVNNGFCEVINDPFTSEHEESSIKIDNPLDSNRNYLRTSLKNSLIENLLYNERRQQDSIKFFEISNIYKFSEESSKRFIGIIVSGRVDKNFKDFAKKLDKNYLENFLKNNIESKIALNCEVISRHNPKPRSTNEIVYIEIELDDIINIENSDEFQNTYNLDIKYEPVSDYPSSNRDLSFSIKDYSQCNKLEDYILNFNDELLKEVYIFDYFINEKKSEIKIGFRLTFQSNHSTITEKEVNNVMNKIISKTKSLNGVSIPGLE